MADWYLTFRGPSYETPIAACEQVAKTIYSTPVTTTYGELDGNPYDTYFRGIWIETRSPDGAVRVTFSFVQNLGSNTGKSPDARLEHVIVGELDPTHPQYQSKLVAWRALRDGFAALGLTDETGPSGRIIGDAEAAGDLETAAFVRAQPGRES